MARKGVDSSLNVRAVGKGKILNKGSFEDDMATKKQGAAGSFHQCGGQGEGARLTTSPSPIQGGATQITKVAARAHNWRDRIRGHGYDVAPPIASFREKAR